jgi:hypothetical protein
MLLNAKSIDIEIPISVASALYIRLLIHAIGYSSGTNTILQK